MKVVKVLMILLLVMSQAFAIDVTPIKKGVPAPKDGFFVDAETMKKFRKTNEEKKLLTRENLTLKEIGRIDQRKIKIYQGMADNAHRQLNWEQTKGHFKGIGGFVLGTLITGAIGYAALRAKGR